MKKTSLKILSILAILILGLMPLMASAEANIGYFYVNTNDEYGLKCRTTPEKLSNDANLVCKIPHRAYVLVYQYNNNGTWAYIEAQNPNGKGTVKGWCMKQFLSAKDPGPIRGGGGGTTPSTTIETLNAVAKKIQYLEIPYPTFIITKNPGACVHLRSFPDTKAVFYGEYYANTPVNVLAMSSKWALVQVAADGRVGYVLADNVSMQ